jgi:hypothetical protein
MAAEEFKPSRRYQHQPLKHQDSIRLARLRPGNFKSPIIIELIQASLEYPPSYKALSYIWGSPVGDVPVCCDGEELLITANCVAALRRTRHRVRTCVLWIDAICIDQTSIEELNHQVALMGDVYSKASEVTIWLGEETHFSRFAMTFLTQYYWIFKINLSERLRTYLLKKEIGRLKGKNRLSVLFTGAS